jgi:hypothetical protein
LNPPNWPVTNCLETGRTIGDKDISRRCLLLFDFDPTRFGPDGKELGEIVIGKDGKEHWRKLEVCSNDTEKALAKERALACKDYFLTLGAPEPILADSGNGWHLLWVINVGVKDGEDTSINFDAVYETLKQKFGDE